MRIKGIFIPILLTFILLVFLYMAVKAAVTVLSYKMGKTVVAHLYTLAKVHNVGCAQDEQTVIINTYTTLKVSDTLKIHLLLDSIILEEL